MKHGNHDGVGIERQLHNPVEDKLIPLEPLDLGQVHSIDALVRAMGKTAEPASERAKMSNCSINCDSLSDS